MNMIPAYQRTETANKVAAGTFLHTRAQSRMIALARHAKLDRVNRSTLPYKMRLNALIVADNRKGKRWP